MTSGLSGTTGIRVTYATKGAGNLGVLSISWVATYEVPVISTSITASVNKVFSVGERITKSDITVLDDKGRNITNFNFDNDNYQFVFSDSVPGGSTSTKKFINSITYNDLSCDLVASVKRDNYIKPSEGDTITLTSSEIFINIGGSNSNLKTGTVTYQDMTYAYNSAYYYSNGSSLSFGNASSQVGYLINQKRIKFGWVRFF